MLDLVVGFKISTWKTLDTDSIKLGCIISLMVKKIIFLNWQSLIMIHRMIQLPTDYIN